MASTRKRLQIKGSREPSEHVDGAWWPRSKRLTDELPELLGAVHDRVGPVAAVAYRNDGWTATKPEMSYGGADTVRLVSFESAEPPSVIVIGRNGHHLTLRVISPETDRQRALELLDSIPDRPVPTVGAARLRHVRSPRWPGSWQNTKIRPFPGVTPKSWNGARRPHNNSTMPGSRPSYRSSWNTS